MYFSNLHIQYLAATNTGIKSAGIDARLQEIGNDISEVFEGAEICIFQNRKHQVLPSRY